eukprot:357410-Chlamydomonas_euryale.AAC.2
MRLHTCQKRCALRHMQAAMRFDTCKQRCAPTHASSDALPHMQAAMRTYTCKQGCASTLASFHTCMLHLPSFPPAGICYAIHPPAYDM